MNNNVTFEDEIFELRELDSLRTLTKKMIDEGIEGLSDENYSEGRKDWHEPGDFIEKALLTTVINKNLKLKNKIKDPLKLNLPEELAQQKLQKLFEVKDFFEDKDDHAPVLKASTTLEALSCIPGASLSEGAINSFCRIIYELNSTSKPDEMMGGAGAGAEDVPQTSFITWKCVNALLLFSKVFSNTAEFLKNLSSLTEEKPRNVPEEWWRKHTETKKISSLITQNILKNNILFEMENKKSIEIKDIDEYIIKINESFFESLNKGKKNIDISLNELEKTEDLGNPKINKFAIIIVKNLLSEFKEIIETLTSKSIVNNKQIIDQLNNISRKIKEILDPSKKFFRSIMDHELTIVQINPQRTCDVAELLFAAIGYIKLTNRKDYRLIKTLETAVNLLTNEGRLPSHRPFDVVKKGYVIHVSGTEVIKAFSMLINQTKFPVNSETIQKFIQYFIETWREDAKGWIHERDHAKGKCQWWLSALSISTLESIKLTLNQRINQIILKHFSVKHPEKIILELENLFYPDYGMAEVGIRATSVAIAFQRLRAHVHNVNLPSSYTKLHSAILYGPPGTGKTTLVEALAKSANVPLIEITPSDILVAGAEKVETRARLVFEALSMLSNVVILLDEFDPVIWQRNEESSRNNIFEFLTPGMLPKLKNLNENAKRQCVSFVLSTNFIGGLDDAAIREGRFDEKIGIFPPDILSRYGRFTYELSKIIEDDKFENFHHSKKIFNIIKDSAGRPMNRLGKPGWFTKQKKEKQSKGTPFYYLLNDDENKINWPPVEKELPDSPFIINKKNDESKLKPISLKEFFEWKWIALLDEIYSDDANKIDKKIKQFEDKIKQFEEKVNKKNIDYSFNKDSIIKIISLIIGNTNYTQNNK